MSEKFATLTQRLKLYANVNAYDMAALRSNLERPDNAEVRDIFRRELEELISTLCISRDDYERLTGEAFDDDDEYRKALEEIRESLFA